MPQTNINQIANNSCRSIGRAQQTIRAYHPGVISFTPCDQGWKEDSNEDSDEETVVLNDSDELRTSGHPIDRLRWSDPVEGRIDTANIDEPSRSDDDGSSSDDGELGTWRDSAGKTL